MACVLLILIGLVSVSHGVVPKEFDCGMRELALEYALEIQPFLTLDKLQEIADALNGSPEAQNCNISPNKTLINFKNIRSEYSAPSWIDLNDDINIYNPYVIFVDYTNGDNLNNGSLNYPIKNLENAIILLRKRNNKNKIKKIILRSGKHYIQNTIYLTEKDNNLLITNYNNELVELSAAIPLNCEWKPMGNSNYLYQCDLSSTNITNIYGLRINGSRAIRARYPNGNSEVYPCGFCSNLNPKSWLPPTCNNHPDIEINPEYPLRNDSAKQSAGGYFDQYQLGIGGCCDIFVPNAGYWCGSHASGGGAATFTTPSGLVFDSKILPNSPYVNATGAVIQTWRPGHWSSWMFEVGDYDKSSSTFKFKRGGFQGARGNKNGNTFYIENVFEELDYPTEWFFNTTTQTLYYYTNNSILPSDLLFEITNLKVLFNYTNTSNMEIRGLTIKDTQYTYMDDHGMPSGGDWALQRQGCIYLANVENIMISSNIFTRLDGNAISINKYARNVTIYRNEIVWNGDNGVSLWGDTYINNESVPQGMGWNGSSGNQPRFINFTQNFVHEVGIFEKQSSMYFQAKSMSNLIDRNIFFNGPRAGINFNDGFGGNSTISSNLLFNSCRESSDHGPINTWDRQVYTYDNTNSVIKYYDNVYKNFLIANYGANWGVDNDDGSCYYKTYNNFISYAQGGMKNYAGGHDNHQFNNIYAWIGTNPRDCQSNGMCGICFDITPQIEGHIDWWYNNTCVIDQDKPPVQYGFINMPNKNCSYKNPINTWPLVGNNTIYTNNNSVNGITGLCGLSESEFQKTYGMDLGTVIMGTPDINELLQKAKQILWG